MAYRTRQEIFNVAYRGLASQGFRQSMQEGLGCAYRGGHNLRCAIGWCISDGLYLPEVEGCSPESLAFGVEGWYLQEAAGIAKEDVGFACSLQKVHDSIHSDTPSEMKLNLEGFARDRGLTIPEGFDNLLTAQEPEAATTELEEA